MGLLAGKQVRDRAITSAKVNGSVLSTDGTNTPPGAPYDALLERLQNLADPVNPQDAVTLAYLITYVANFMDNSTATRVSSTGFVSSFSVAGNISVVDAAIELSDALQGDQGILYVQIFNGTAPPVAGTQALYSYPANALDRITYAPPGREGFSVGFTVCLSTTDNVYTASAETVLSTTVRYFP